MSLYEVVATTFSGDFGAGKTFADWPEMVGNIIPYIGGEGIEVCLHPVTVDARESRSFRQSPR